MLFAAKSTGALLLQGGVFTDNFTALDSGNDGYSIDGRVVYAPKVGKTQLHICITCLVTPFRRTHGVDIARGHTTTKQTDNEQ